MLSGTSLQCLMGRHPVMGSKAQLNGLLRKLACKDHFVIRFYCHMNFSSGPKRELRDVVPISAPKESAAQEAETLAG